MTDYDGEDFVEDTQDYIEETLETGSQQSLEAPTQRAEQLQREIADLERQLEQQGSSDELSERLRQARGDLDALRARERR